MFGIPLHLLVIHFPIALALIAAIYDSWAIYAKRSQAHEAGYSLTVWAAVGAVASVVSGLDLAGGIRVSKAAVTGHAGFGLMAAIALTALAVMRYASRAREQSEYRIVWLLMEWGAAALIAATAVTGHRL